MGELGMGELVGKLEMAGWMGCGWVDCWVDGWVDRESRILI